MQGRKSIPDKIMSYLVANPKSKSPEIVLDEKELDVLERYNVINGLMNQHRPVLKVTQIANIACKRFKISPSQFYKDKYNVERIFGQINSVSKIFMRNAMVDRYQQLAHLAEISGDLKSAISALDSISRILNLDKQDDERPTEIEPKTYIYTMAYLGAADKKIATKSFDLLNMDKLDITDLQNVIEVSDKPRVNVKDMELILDINDKRNNS